MAYIADIILIAIFALVIIISAHKGFFKSLIDFAGSFIAIIAARVLSSTFAVPVYDSLVKHGVENTLISRLGEGASVDYTQQLEEVINALPESISGVLQMMGLDREMLAEKISSANLNGENLIESLMNTVITPVATAVIQFIMFAFLAIVLIIIIKFLGRLLDKIIKKLPVIKGFNKTLGGVFGVLRGAIDVVVVSLLISVVAGFVSNQEFMAAVDSSVIINAVRNIFTSLVGISI
ncbi:MAG: CvpA family protein [Clostridia bacterium]|nr:CvpA family protein [Clostridia bacterium]